MGIGDYPPDEIPDLVQKAKQCTCSPYFGCSEYAPDCPVHSHSDQRGT